MNPVLEFDDVTIGYRREGTWRDVVRDVSFRIEAGQTYGLVGESGSGKSTLALAAMRYLDTGGAVRAGTIRLEGRDLYGLAPTEVRRVWRDRVALVPQDPLPSLNPAHTIGRQVREAVAPDRTGARTATAVLDLLARVGLPDPERTAGSYPFEVSGGQQQRVLIAMALAARPALLVLDEPTTNLDVTTEAAILDLVADLVRELETAVLFVSHSLGVVARVCDRVAVLYAGELVEDAPVEDLYGKPLHPYTRGLLDAVPSPDARVSATGRTLRAIPGRLPEPGTEANACRFVDRCTVAVSACHERRPTLASIDGGARRSRCLRWDEIAAGELDPRPPAATADATRTPAEGPPALRADGLAVSFPVPRDLGDLLRGAPRQAVRAVDGVDLRVPAGATVGLVGESGSGKSTLARAIAGLIAPERGRLELFGVPLAPRLAHRDRATLRRLQMVFQSSDEALNPYRSVGATLRRPLARLLDLSRDDADRRVAALLERVKLDPSYASRRPAQLSGGERQRVAIARAFASEPDLVVLDESVSGLDVSVQAAILDLLRTLQLERGRAYLFISHDLGVVANLSDVIAVLYLGRIVEIGPTETVLSPPYHPYTEALLSAAPIPDPAAPRPRIRLEGEVPSPVDVPTGCRFHTRCPRVLGDVCRTEPPPWRDVGDGSGVECHIPVAELRASQAPIFAAPGRRTAASSETDEDAPHG